jgi:hypothetical protein
VDAEAQRHRISFQWGDSSAPIRAICSGMFASRGTTATTASSPASAQRASARRQSAGVRRPTVEHLVSHQ